MSTDSLTGYILSRIARNPSLISESPASVRLAASNGGGGSSSSHTSSNTNSNGSGSLNDSAGHLSASTLDAIHREVLAPYLTSSTSAPSPSTSLNKTTTTMAMTTPKAADANATAAAAVTALVQRLVVDAPLLPLGGEHILYEVLLPPFYAAAEAARALGEVSQKKLQQQHESASMDAVAVGATTSINDEVTTTATATTTTTTVGGKSASGCDSGEEETALRVARAELARAFTKARWLTTAMAAFSYHANNDSSKDRKTMMDGLQLSSNADLMARVFGTAASRDGGRLLSGSTLFPTVATATAAVSVPLVGVKRSRE